MFDFIFPLSCVLMLGGAFLGKDSESGSYRERVAMVITVAGFILLMVGGVMAFIDLFDYNPEGS